MASAFGHSVGAWAISNLFKLKHPLSAWVVFLGVVCSIFPDIDVISFSVGIPYESMFGHRGFTHSIFFAFLFSGLLTLFFLKTKQNLLVVFLFLFCCTISHAMLDACTTGGKGVAFLSPFSNERFFFPWKVIKVSPVSIGKFFSSWGIKVLKSEFLFIGLPAIFVWVVTNYFRKNRVL